MTYFITLNKSVPIISLKMHYSMYTFTSTKQGKIKMVTRQNLQLFDISYISSFLQVFNKYVTTYWRMLCTFTTNLLQQNLRKLATNEFFTVD